MGDEYETPARGPFYSRTSNRGLIKLWSWIEGRLRNSDVRLYRTIQKDNADLYELRFVSFD